MLFVKIEYMRCHIKGLGPKKAALLARLGINTLEDLIFHFPHKWLDLRLEPEEEEREFVIKIHTIFGQVLSKKEIYTKGGLAIFKALIKRTSGGETEAVFFKRGLAHFDVFSKLRKDFKQGNYVWLSGESDDIFLSELKVKHYCPNDCPKRKVHIGEIIPVYPLTEGISGSFMREAVFSALNIKESEIIDFLPRRIREKRCLLPRALALRQLHFPANYAQLEEARRRFIYEELLLFTIACAIRRRQLRERPKHFSYLIKRHLLTPFRHNLGFELTRQQKHVINEIFKDMRSPVPMARLLEGEVGSGKTVVALASMLLAAENGAQSAFITPTEILALQHYFTFEKFLAGLNISFALLTGNISASKRKAALLGLAEGRIDIIIGTHAMLSEGVKFKNLRLIVVDEQQRFGVRQRAALRDKGELADMLVMTATPIPRSLFLALYGDLDLSIIKELPLGRGRVETIALSYNKALERVEESLKRGDKVYMVYPAIEEGGSSEIKAVKSEFEKIKLRFPNAGAELLHGRMKSAEKRRVMERFANGCAQILVATQIVEVGLDVPEARLMVINNAERFGLATLHQLRGRIARSKANSCCIIVGDAASKEAKARISALVNCSSGFELSEKDIYLRGAGDIFTDMQHGEMGFRLADLSRDNQILKQAISDKDELLSIDPNIMSPDNLELRKKLLNEYSEKWKLIDLS